MGEPGDVNDAAGDVDDYEAEMLSLPDSIEPGDFTISFGSDVAGGDLQQYEVRFSWDGGRHVNWVQDIGYSSELSPASSAPVYGWASWLNFPDALIAFYSPDAGIEDSAHLDGAAPDTENPETWLDFARRITAAIYGV